MSRNITDLINLGLIRAPEVLLGPRRQKCRRLYECREFGLWSDSLSSTPRSSQLLSERGELDTVYSEFVGGRPMAGVIVGVTKPAGRGIFKIKTTSFRLFGWAPAAQTIVLCHGARKSEFADRTIIERHIPPLVLALRQAMGVTEEAHGQWHELFAPDR
jgi:hypothetical protein